MVPTLPGQRFTLYNDFLSDIREKERDFLEGGRVKARIF